MKHPTSRMLYHYWDQLRGTRAAPERSEIEPGEIRNLLSESLILELDMARSVATVRLAGTRVCALFGRELRGSAFAAIWGEGQADPWRLVETVAVDTVGIVAGLRGMTQRDEQIDLELLLLPLRHRGQTQVRLLGALSPKVVPQWLGLRPVERLESVSLRVLDPTYDVIDLARSDAAANLRNLPQPANDSLPVRRGHLMVHPGGRA
ncbi:PAS domain-containing protein [Methylobacterium sp. Leaf106]|uniref:PAS domain-containing protein n=1 Tax=Methylobacterium sp. Leaf106 TaxID=1736255 RepID=UPI0006F39745|nr:PAS domain-containing protein [Methylobacterium sp. Leaf106]KQP39552.1 PAS domain-containing protein [Methylobacterium sp. Leaf106]